MDPTLYTKCYSGNFNISKVHGITRTDKIVFFSALGKSDLKTQ